MSSVNRTTLTDNQRTILQSYTGLWPISPFDFSKPFTPVSVPVTSDPCSWATVNAQIVHPARGRIAFSPYAYQANLFAQYATPRRLILKARQIGFSQAFAIEALFAAISAPESTILLVSRSQDLAVNLLRYCYLTYNNLNAAPQLTKANESEMGFVNGSRIKSIPANRSTGRGFTANRVYLDEFAYAEYADDIYQSVAPALSQGGHLTIGSTPNGVGNLFHKLWHGDTTFWRQCVPWHHCPSYWTADEQAAGISKEQSAWYLRERERYPAQAWAAEYECSFEGSGLGLFAADAIERATNGAVGDQAPQAGRSYLTSVDVGRRRDATVINTFDSTEVPYQRVAFERLERVPYPVMQQKVAERSKRYPGRVLVESNGVGDPFIENTDAPITPFVTTGRSRVQAWRALQLLVQH